jgi:hypothetical protein
MKNETDGIDRYYWYVLPIVPSYTKRRGLSKIEFYMDRSSRLTIAYVYISCKKSSVQLSAVCINCTISTLQKFALYNISRSSKR